MPISELTSRQAVLAAIEEFDQVGQPAFLAKYGYSKALKFSLRHKGKLYDSKAIAGVAWGIQLHADGSRKPDSYSGGAHTSVPTLEKLNFKIVEEVAPALPKLRPGAIYSWQTVARKFAFKPKFFSINGGMLSRPAFNSLLLITSFDQSSSFSYDDEWDPKTGDLIYAGKGLNGHQQLTGVNRYVAENSRELFLFEYAGAEKLLFHDRVSCIQHWEDIAPDKKGKDRRVYQFRLRLDGGNRAQQKARSRKANRDADSSPRSTSSFKPRPFDPDRTPSQRRRSAPEDQESRRVAQEQADQNHQATLRTLGLWLEESGWTNLEEIDGAIDLRAKRPGRGDHRRVLFEIKSTRPKSERGAVRSGLAQLFEYRYLFGSSEDKLCLVTNRPINTQRRRLLNSLDIGHAYIEKGKVHISGTTASRAIFR
jgi:hypothetical protein